MKIIFIANACCLYEVDGFRILTDPWLSETAFDSWFHYPPLKTKVTDILGVDALYISHVHPDHFDEKTLSQFRKDIPIVILKSEPSILETNLKRLGFSNITALPNRGKTYLGPFLLTVFSPFATNLFHEAHLPNVLDSALLVQSYDFSVFNANDNTPTLETCAKLRHEYGKITLAQLNYNPAGAYPSCFVQHSLDERIKLSHKVIRRNLEYLTQMAEVLSPKYVMPFAGHYVLGGRLWEKNECLGTTTWDEAAFYLRESTACLPLVLQEGNSFDLGTQRYAFEYKPASLRKQKEYIRTVLWKKKYPYESDPEPEMDELEADLILAREHLWQFQKKLGVFPDFNIAIDLKTHYFRFNFLFREPKSSTKHPKPYLVCKMDLRVLKRILERKLHWNNVEIGCHIDFIREPDTYQPDIHFMMSFFHL